MKKRVVLPVILLIIMATMLACQFTSIIPTPTVNTDPIPTLASNLQPVALADQQELLTTIYQQFSPGVVSIRTSTGQGSGWVL